MKVTVLNLSGEVTLLNAMDTDKNLSTDKDETLKRPQGLLTDKEMEEGGERFLALVLERQKRIEEAKRLRGIQDKE